MGLLFLNVWPYWCWTSFWPLPWCRLQTTLHIHFYTLLIVGCCGVMYKAVTFQYCFCHGAKGLKIESLWRHYIFHIYSTSCSTLSRDDGWFYVGMKKVAASPCTSKFMMSIDFFLFIFLLLLVRHQWKDDQTKDT